MTFREGGSVRLFRLEGMPDEESYQVAVGEGPEGPHVLLRVGAFVWVLTKDQAVDLATELMAEVNVLNRRRVQ
jgi:hypothetical protein